MKKRFFKTTLITILSVLSSPTNVFAATSGKIGCGGNLGPIAEFVCTKLIDNPTADRIEVGKKLNEILSFIIGFMTVVAALWFIFQFITAGYQWISSSGDKGKLETAQKKLQYSIIGLVIVVSAWVVIGLIGRIIGLDILNPGKILQTIGIQP